MPDGLRNTTFGSRGDSSCASLFAEVKDAHEALIAAMTEFELITREAVCHRSRFANARWRLSQKSLSRRLLWSRIFGYLRLRVGADDAAALSQLQKADQDMLGISANHVRTWTVDSIERDWTGYCEASRAIRWQMRATIGAEQRIVYPLLRHGAERGFGAR